MSVPLLSAIMINENEEENKSENYVPDIELNKKYSLYDLTIMDKENLSKMMF